MNIWFLLQDCFWEPTWWTFTLVSNNYYVLYTVLATMFYIHRILIYSNLFKIRWSLLSQSLKSDKCEILKVERWNLRPMVAQYINYLIWMFILQKSSKNVNWFKYTIALSLKWRFKDCFRMINDHVKIVEFSYYFSLWKFRKILSAHPCYVSIFFTVLLWNRLMDILQLFPSVWNY